MKSPIKSQDGSTIFFNGKNHTYTVRAKTKAAISLINRDLFPQFLETLRFKDNSWIVSSINTKAFDIIRIKKTYLPIRNLQN